ncbi:hypothetical protein V8G54_030926 [Vigna mungo]|uniref:Cullin N-terminal domain-containing protein n=1 Tax=Vigna mungo TaxID=3915 RepID=A0AAQ3MY30_VIGMU
MSFFLQRIKPFFILCNGICGFYRFTAPFVIFEALGRIDWCGSFRSLHNVHFLGAWFKKLRKGEAVDKTLRNHLLKMFTALRIYPESFEKPFLECTSEFYAAEGVKYMHQSDAPDYLKHVEGKILKQRPILIVASMRSYGAYLAYGSEYR